MFSFVVGLLVILVLIIACLAGLFVAGVVFILGIALIFLLKFFIVIFVIVFIIWLIGKITRIIIARQKNS